MLSCPLCDKPLHREERSTVIVDVCSEHGIWLDHSELLAITEAERHAMGAFVWGDIFRRPVTPPTDRGRTLMCPSVKSPWPCIARMRLAHAISSLQRSVSLIVASARVMGDGSWVMASPPLACRSGREIGGEGTPPSPIPHHPRRSVGG